MNRSKSQIVHFRKYRCTQTSYKFMYQGTKLEIVSNYKYLGVIFNEHLNYDICSKTLAESGGRALGAIWCKFKLMKDVGFKTYSKLYETGVIPVLNYGSSIWGTFQA